MAEMPKHITITVDEDALTEQVRGIIQREMREASMALRDAADALDPKFVEQHVTRLREQWDREQAAKVTKIENRSQ